MSGSLNYDKDFMKLRMKRTKSPEEKAQVAAGDFPNCKGLYPDCPEKPSLKEKACRTCPKTEDLEPEEIEEE